MKAASTWLGFREINLGQVQFASAFEFRTSDFIFV